MTNAKLTIALTAAFLSFTLQAQTPAKKYAAPRTANGQPDLQGIWNNSTVTPLERPPELAGKAIFTPAEALAYEKDRVEQSDVDKRRKEGGQTDVALAYNEAWWDRGTHVVKTLRTSLITDPKDGKLPALTPDGKQRADALAEQRRLHPADGPESRGLTERCILWPEAGPPMMPGPYNNNYQIFQSKDTVTILVEMIHDARVIPLDNRPHLPSNVRQWMGDSRGHWDGDTLVVETANFSDKTRFRGTTRDMKLTERFTRTDANTIAYEFTVVDPETYTAPWTAQMTMAKSDSPIYEYACHEGNYGMVGILSGARSDEKKVAQ